MSQSCGESEITLFNEENVITLFNEENVITLFNVAYTDFIFLFEGTILRVPGQNGISQACYIVKIYTILVQNPQYVCRQSQQTGWLISHYSASPEDFSF